jgi:hypothetical protein
VSPDDLIREWPFAARFTHDGAELIVDGKVDLVFRKDGVWHIVDYKFSEQEAESLRSRYALQLAVYREALAKPAEPAPLRIPRFDGAGRAPAPFRLLLLSVTESGTSSILDLTDEAPDPVAPALIAAARSIHA